MAVIPRSLFASDGTLLIPSDKSSFMKEIEKYSSDSASQDSLVDGDHCITSDPNDIQQTPEPNEEEMVDILEGISNNRDKVIIIDGQAVVQCMKKSPGMDTIKDFGEAFQNRISRMVKYYSEVRLQA